MRTLSRKEGPDFRALLNDAQYEAVTHGEGPLLIIAGAGSGKTRTLVHRVAWLIASGVPAERILLLTFTRKAAREMLVRAESLVGGAPGPDKGLGRVQGGTFHSVANSLLRKYARHIGYPSGFTILDQADAVSLVGRALSETGREEGRGFPKNAAVLNVISMANNLDLGISRTITSHFPHLSRFSDAIKNAAHLYQKKKGESSLMDFDDLLIKLSELMSGNDNVRTAIASRYDHVLVDEYQDTNPIQARIAFLLAKDHRNITAVGDEAQSIYGFRGATFRNIMDFPKIFQGTRTLTLERNYRSVAPVLDLANAVLLGAEERYEKNLVSVRGKGAIPVLHVCESPQEEALRVTWDILRLLSEGESLKDMAVLFRAASHSYELERQLNRADIPFTKYGGLKFMETAHNKDFASFLRVAVNPADRVSLERILTMIRGVGILGARKLIDSIALDREGLSNLDPKMFRQQAQGQAGKLSALFNAIMRENAVPYEIVPLVRDYYLEMLPDLYPEDHPARKNDIQDFVATAMGESDLTTFVNEISLDPPQTKDYKGTDRREPQDLTLSTVHSAKGLEWKHLFLISLVDGRVPPSFAMKMGKDNEEERRLFYVAVTRAKDTLTLMFPGDVMSYDGSLDQPTRYLTELPLDSMEIRKAGKRIPYKKFFPNAKPNALGPSQKDLESDFQQDPLDEIDADPFANLDYDDSQPFADSTDDGRDKDPLPYDDWPAATGKASKPAHRKGARAGKGASTRRKAKKQEKPSEPPTPALDKGNLVTDPKTGDRVEHLTFGLGTVHSVRDEQVVVTFDSHGRKTFNINYAVLYKAK